MGLCHRHICYWSLSLTASQLFQKLQQSFAVQTSLREFLPESSAPYSTPFTHTASSASPLSSDISTLPSSTHDIIAYRSKESTPTAPPIAANAPTYTEVHSPIQRPDRPGLLVSSTSWTPDEDFGILLEAMGIYDGRARELNTVGKDSGKLPKLLVVLTGKGPLREKYMMEAGKLQEKWEWVRCISLWLEAEDYPMLLGTLLAHASKSIVLNTVLCRFSRPRGMPTFQFFSARSTYESG